MSSFLCAEPPRLSSLPVTLGSFVNMRRTDQKDPKTDKATNNEFKSAAVMNQSAGETKEPRFQTPSTKLCCTSKQPPPSTHRAPQYTALSTDPTRLASSAAAQLPALCSFSTMHSVTNILKPFHRRTSGEAGRTSVHFSSNSGAWSLTPEHQEFSVRV